MNQYDYTGVMMDQLSPNTVRGTVGLGQLYKLVQNSENGTRKDLLAMDLPGFEDMLVPSPPSSARR